MFFFKKKLTPMELRTKLSIAEKKLSKRERVLKSKKEKARLEAREALKNGDERGFRLASKRFALANGQINAISGMVEMAAVMLDLVEMQTGIKELVEIGALLKGYQESLGVNEKQMTEALTNMSTSMEKVNMAAEMINTSMEVATSGDISTDEAQEQLRAELSAELEAETAGGGLEERIAQARKNM